MLHGFVHQEISETALPAASISSSNSSCKIVPDENATSSALYSTSKANKRTQNKCDELLEVIGKRLQTTSNQDDKYTCIAKTWAWKLGELTTDQSIIAEKIINDVFYEASQGNLTRNSGIRDISQPVTFFGGYQQPGSQQITTLLNNRDISSLDDSAALFLSSL